MHLSGCNLHPILYSFYTHIMPTVFIILHTRLFGGVFGVFVFHTVCAGVILSGLGREQGAQQHVVLKV